MKFKISHLKMNFLLLILFIISKLYTSKNQNKKENKKGISDINVLLPICESSNCNRVSYEIEAYGGCFNWRLDKPELIDLELFNQPNEEQDCFSIAKISPKNVFQTNNVVLLDALDRNSNEIYRCRIGFGKIKKIKIIKRFDVINIGEIVELDVKGFDEKDNAFSSLEGLKFEWKISRNDLVEIIINNQKKKFAYRRTELGKKSESDIINLKGINTGKITLSTELIDESFKGLKTKERNLYIIQPFKIFPEEPLYILNQNNFQFDITLQKHYINNYGLNLNSEEEDYKEDFIDHSCFKNDKTCDAKKHLKFVESKNRKHYTWKVSNDSCGFVKDFGYFSSITKNCKTKLIAKDNRIDAFNEEENLVHVVEPTSLELGLYQLNLKELKIIIAQENNKNIENLLIDDSSLLVHDQFLTNTNSYKFNSDWKLITGNFYLIKNFLMFERHPIYFDSEKIQFNIRFDLFEGYIKKVKCIDNNKLCLIYVTRSNIYEKIETGKNKEDIKNQEKFLESNVPYSHLSENEISEYNVSKRIQIFDKLKIMNFNQNKFYLPYLGYKNSTNSKSELENILLEQELHFKVFGGSQKYRYISSDRNVIDIRNGVIYGRNVGTAIVTVRDDEIENTYDTIEIEVKEIMDINYFEERQEVLIEKPFIVAPVAGFEIGITKKLNEQPLIFTNCSNVHLEPSFSFKNRNFKKLDMNFLLNDKQIGKYFLENFKLNLITNNQDSLSESHLKNIFIKRNKKLINLKLKSLGLNKNSAKNDEIEYINYLRYANFGVCKLFAYKSDHEGMIEIGFSTTIENHENKIEKTYSSLISRINIYKPLILSSPIISDIITKELYMKSPFDFESKVPNSFILAPGSGVNIKLTGGVEKWTENHIDYQENQFVVDKKNNYTSSIDLFKNKFSYKGKEKDFTYECKKSFNGEEYDNNDYEIEIVIQNKQDISLINPAKTFVSFNIGCQEPKSVSLFLLGLGFSDYIFDSKLTDELQEKNINTTKITNLNLNLVDNKQCDDVFNVPQKENIKYFEQKASFDGLRIYSFDEKKRMIFNFTSFRGSLEIEKSDEDYSEAQNKKNNLIKIYSQKQLFDLIDVFKQLNTKENIQSKPEEFNESLVDLDELTKLMKLEKNSQNQEFLYNSIYFHNVIQKLKIIYRLSNKISQSAIIEVIDIPTFSPNNSTLYLSENNSIFLDILHGSGDFEFFVNKNDLATYEYSRIDNKVKITGIKAGVFTISIKDRKIGIEHKSVAIIYISPIKSIELIGGGLLMVNETAQIEMKVYNIYDQTFPIEEVKKMNIIVDKSSFKNNGIKIKSSDVDYNQNLEELSKLSKFFEKEPFIHAEENDSTITIVSKYIYFQGSIADFYSISVLKENLKAESKKDENKLEGKNNIRSNYVKIEIFKRLDIYPSSLLMIPGSQYTLSIEGGPSNEKIIVKKFEISDKNIALVGSNEPQILANKVGQTILKITISVKEEEPVSNDANLKSIIKSKEKIIATQNVSIRVDFPDSVEIIGAYNRKIYTKSTIRLYAALKLGKETFTYSYGPIKFNWLVDNSLIANLKQYNKDGCGRILQSDDPNMIKTCKIERDNSNIASYYNSIGTFLKTYKQGISEVKLRVDINYPEPYKNHKPNSLTHTEKILIDDNIFVDIAEFYDKDPNKSGLYLIPFNVDHDLVTNKNKNDLKYTLVSQHCKSNDPLIDLRENGRITTYDRRGLAYVMIEKKVIDNKPFMPLVLPVYVVEFYSIFVERSYQTIDTEIGQSITLKVLLQHEYGLLFAEKFERLELVAEISNPNIAQIELLENNSKIRIHGNNKGQANIILLHPISKKIFDVFNINVYPSILLPEKIVLNVGAEIDFLKKDEEKRMMIVRHSEWIVDDPNIFKFEENSGKGIALREGRTRVHLISKDLRKEKLATEIIVSRIRRVNVDFSLLPKYFTDIMNDPFFRSEYKIPLKFYINDNMEELTNDSEDDINLVDQKINVKCISKQPEIFLAEIKNEAYETLTESSEIYSHKNNTFCSVTIRKIPFDIEIPQNLLLNIVIDSSASLKQEKYIYESLIKIPFTSSFRLKEDIQLITIMKENRTYILEINNANDIDIHISNPNNLLVHQTKEGEKNLLRFFVPNTVRENFKDNLVTITNRITGQQKAINVNFGESQGSEALFNLFSREYIVDFITLLIIIVIIYVLVIHNFSSPNNNIVENRPIPPKVNPPSYQNKFSSSNLNFNKKSYSNY